MAGDVSQEGWGGDQGDSGRAGVLWVCVEAGYGVAVSGAGRGAGACEARFDGTASRCLDGLRGEESKVGWMLMVVPIGVFLWKVSNVAFWEGGFLSFCFFGRFCCSATWVST